MLCCFDGEVDDLTLVALVACVSVVMWLHQMCLVALAYERCKAASDCDLVALAWFPRSCTNVGWDSKQHKRPLRQTPPTLKPNYFFLNECFTVFLVRNDVVHASRNERELQVHIRSLAEHGVLALRMHKISRSKAAFEADRTIDSVLFES